MRDFLAGGDAPAVAAAHERALDPDVQRVAFPACVGMHLEPARERRLGRLELGCRQDSPPAERVDDERRMQRSAVSAHGDVLNSATGLGRRAAGATLDLRCLEVRVAALGPQVLAQLAVVEGRPAPGQPSSARSSAAC